MGLYYYQHGRQAPEGVLAQQVMNTLPIAPLYSNFTRTSFCDEYSGSLKIATTWIILVIVRQHLVQIGRIDGPAESLL